MTVNDYSFAFNGQEKDNEVNGEGNSYTAEYWQYDPRIARRWNVDPKPNPSISIYAAFGNNPIIYSDTKGDTLRVSCAQYDIFMEDMTSIFGDNINTMLQSDEFGNISLTDEGRKLAYAKTSLGGAEGKLYEGLTKLIDDKDVTNIVYSENEIVNPETGKEYETKNGIVFNAYKLKDYYGEATTTLWDIKKKNFIKATQNTITIHKDKVHAFLETGYRIIEGVKLSEYATDERANQLIHGMGHVLFQKNSEQEKVIEFDNFGRQMNGQPLREVDTSHQNTPD